MGGHHSSRYKYGYPMYGRSGMFGAYSQ